MDGDLNPTLDPRSPQQAPITSQQPASSNGPQIPSSPDTSSSSLLLLHYLLFFILPLTSSSGRSGSRWVRLCRTTGLRSSTTSSLTPSQMFRTLHDESNMSTSCPGLTRCASLCIPGEWTMGARRAEPPPRVKGGRGYRSCPELGVLAGII